MGNQASVKLLTNFDMPLFVEGGMHGDISMVTERCTKANKPQVPRYDPSQPNKQTIYFDANNLYGWAMSKPFPKSGFNGVQLLPEEDQRYLIRRRTRNAAGFSRLTSNTTKRYTKSTTVTL